MDVLEAPFEALESMHQSSLDELKILHPALGKAFKLLLFLLQLLLLELGDCAFMLLQFQQGFGHCKLIFIYFRLRSPRYSLTRGTHGRSLDLFIYVFQLVDTDIVSVQVRLD